MKKFLALLLLPMSALAFTPAEITTLRAAVQSEPSIQSCLTAGNDVCVSDWLNSQSTVIVWRTRVTQEEYQTAVSSTGSTFNWSGTGGFIARTQGERDAWRTMFSPGSVNPSQANVRAAFDDIFSGTGAGAVSNRNHLSAVSKRNATVAESVLSTGTGTDASPAVLTYEGRVSVNDISQIMGR